MSRYVKPNDVRSARNYRCVLCGSVFRTPQGLCAHLSRGHGVQEPEYQTHWTTTKQDADVFVKEVTC